MVACSFVAGFRNWPTVSPITLATPDGGPDDEEDAVETICPEGMAFTGVGAAFFLATISMVESGSPARRRASGANSSM